jgi:hypothetical protein
VKRELKASIGQRLLWLLANYRGGNGSLNCPLTCRLEGPLNLDLLGSTLRDLFTRHEALRTTFFRRERQLRQLVHDSVSVELTCVDLEGHAEAELALSESLSAEIRRDIDPTRSSVRVRLWRINSNDHLLCLNMHHLVTDTSSCLVLQRELAALYAARAAGREPPPFRGWQFSQFMAWQDRRLASAESERLRDHWRARLLDARAPCIPAEPAAGREAMRENQHARIPESAMVALRALARAQGVTLFAVMLAVFFALQYRRDAAESQSVASLFSNRTRPEVESTVGFLTNLVVLNARFDAAQSFLELLRVTQTTVLEASANQEVPFHLVSQHAPAGDLRLDDFVFQMLAEPLEESLPAGPLQIRGVAPDVLGRFDFELALMLRPRDIALKFYYTKSRVSAAWVAAFLGEYVELASDLARFPRRTLRELGQRSLSLST